MHININIYIYIHTHTYNNLINENISPGARLVDELVGADHVERRDAADLLRVEPLLPHVQ